MITRTNFRARTVRVSPSSSVGPRGELEEAKRVEYMIDYDENGRTFSDGPFAVTASGERWDQDVRTAMDKTRNALEGFYRNG